MTREEARQIIASWLVSSKGEKGQCGYIEGWFYEKDVEAFHMAIEALEKEPKCGKWIIYPLIDEGRVELECPICGDTFIRAVNYKPHFCENCGARMESEKNE